MQVRYIISSFLLALLCGFLVTACEGPPDDALMDAEVAIKAAINAGADEDSPKLLDKSRRFLQEAKMLSEQGKYEDARKKAGSSVIQANKAKKNAERLTGAAAPRLEAPATEAPVEESTSGEKTE